MMSQTTVLVVEDDAHLLSGIREILELENYAVLTATNGLEGLQILRELETPPDIIISDIMMPQMGGYEFLEEVRKEDLWVSIPFIFLTAKSEKRDLQLGRKLGADVYLTKPFDAEDLIIAVDSRLQRHRNIARVQDNKVNSLKRQLLTVLNHEFRTPLTLVVAYADMLRDFEPSALSEDDLISFLKGVNSGADRLRRLVENFILLVELESGDAEKTYGWRKRPISDIGELIRDVRRQLYSTEGERPCEIIIEDDVDEIIADREFLSAAIRELMHNAFKFSPPDTPITVHVRKKEDMVEISVSDNGRGLPPEEFDKIWDTFYQYNRELYEDQGAGAGLAIVRGVAQMHHGAYTVESVVGEGSRFSIAIPIS